MKKTLFLSAILGAALCSSAFADVNYSRSFETGDSITLGSQVEMGATPVLLTIDVTKLSAVTANTDLITVWGNKNTAESATPRWGLRAVNGGNVTGNWNGGTWTDGGTVQYSSISSAATEGTVQLLATVDNNGTYLMTASNGSTVTALYGSSALRSNATQAGAVAAYKLNDGIVTAANKVVFGNQYTNISGNGTMTLDCNAEVNGGAQGGAVTLDITGHSVTFTGDTTLFEVGAKSNTASGITVKEGVTLTSSINSSWDCGTITLEDNAKIVADHIYITSGNSGTPKIVGAQATVTTSTLETGNVGKLEISVGDFHVTGNVNLGGQGSHSGDKLTVVGGTLTVDGTITVQAGRTLTNNSIINLTNYTSEAVTRSENGYNQTLRQTTIAGAGTVNGTGTWQLGGTTATRDGYALTTTVTDQTEYHVDKADAIYASSLNGKYVVAEGKKLTISGEQTWVEIKENNGTLVADGMSGFFTGGTNTSLGNLEVTANGLTLTDGFSKTTTFGDLSGEGTITTTGTSGPKERIVFTGSVGSSISFNAGRVNSDCVTTFAFTKADVDNVTIKDVTSTATQLNFEAAALTVNSLTLSNGTTVGVYTTSTHNEAHEAELTTTTLTVSGEANLNADLVIADNGKMDFTSGHVLTMGSSVTIGEGVQVYITGSAEDIRYGQEVTIMNSVEEAITLTNALIFVNGVQQNDFYLKRTDDNRLVVAPEPATATLSLLALAALAARRKRH